MKMNFVILFFYYFEPFQKKKEENFTFGTCFLNRSIVSFSASLKYILEEIISKNLDRIEITLNESQ